MQQLSVSSGFSAFARISMAKEKLIRFEEPTNPVSVVDRFQDGLYEQSLENVKALVVEAIKVEAASCWSEQQSTSLS